MPSEPSPELSADLLDEFYSEADEHLSEIRRCLISLEPYTESAQVDAAIADSLFRSFHSFKGNSALVGLTAAEGVAHAAEDYLRQLVRGQARLNAHALDVLMSATQQMEQIVLAYRLHQPIGETQPVLERLRGLLEIPTAPAQGAPERGSRLSAPAGAAKPDVSRLIEHAREQGQVICQAAFVPSRALDARGVHVNSIRSRLQEIGQILSATPQVRGGGSIAFEFVLGVRAVPADLEAWERDGVSFQPWVERTDPGRAAPGREPEPEVHLDPLQSPFIAPSHVVRVDLGRLDELMRLAGQMVIQRARLEEQIQRATSCATKDREGLQEVNLALTRSLRDLRDAIMRVRLVPLAEVFQRMPFVVRDLGRESSLAVKLVVSGHETEIDKYLIERLKDPLLHLVRNAVSHGIEPAEQRLALGKPAEATISLSARTVGDSVLIEIADDGRGIDPQQVAQRARMQGLPVPEPLDAPALLRLICTPGFSTREEADRAAGRGVGMAVVERTVRELAGSLGLETRLGHGTRFSLRLPLTLAIADAFIVTAGEQTFALPQTFVREIVEMRPEQVRRVKQGELFSYRNSVLPLLRMTSLLGLGPCRKAVLPVLILSSEGAATGLVVDRVVGQREIVIRSMRDPLVQSTGFAGATELGDGRPVLILDAGALTSGVVAVRPETMVDREP
jgi:two-component system chemotaxis sensor kinase CheA